NESRRRQQRRRPRSVSGLINPSPQTSQHTHRQKTDIFIKPLISIHSFKKYRQMNGEHLLYLAAGPVQGNMQ
ncbi:hypothetical protein O8B94_14535, partial [Agrobacterium rhizogenes]|uniref:hypothetical protein n=1 Tax=Rhizobium rhizogenes TaxID=359 RepID=UPI0022C895ED